MRHCLLLALVASSSVAYGDDEWTKYESKDPQFSISFPFETSVSSESPALLTVNASNADDSINYGLDVFHMPVISSAGDSLIRTAIAGGVQSSIKALDGEITADCDIVMFGRHGRSYAATGQMNVKPVFFCCRVFSIKDRLYLARITQYGAATVSLMDAMHFFGSFKGASEKNEPPLDPPKVQLPLELVSWSARLEKGQFQTGYNISVKLKNVEKKGTKLAEVFLFFKDILGETVYTIKLDPDKKMLKGTTVDFNGFYPVNQFIPKELRLSKMAKEDVRVQLFIRKVVFDDNSIVDFGEASVAAPLH